MKSGQEQIKQVLHEMGEKMGNITQDAAASSKMKTGDATEDLQKRNKDLFQKATGMVVKEGSNVKDALGLTDAMIEGIYGQAYRLYNTGKFKDASQIFRMLIMLCPNDARFLMGLAACHHMAKDFLSAINTYTICSMLDGENPVPLYHASDCMIQIGDQASALIVLEMAVERAGDKPEYKTLKDRALLTVDSLKKEFAKIANK